MTIFSPFLFFAPQVSLPSEKEENIPKSELFILNDKRCTPFILKRCISIQNFSDFLMHSLLFMWLVRWRLETMNLSLSSFYSFIPAKGFLVISDFPSFTCFLSFFLSFLLSSFLFLSFLVFLLSFFLSSVRLLG